MACGARMQVGWAALVTFGLLPAGCGDDDDGSIRFGEPVVVWDDGRSLRPSGIPEDIDPVLNVDELRGLR